MDDDGANGKDSTADSITLWTGSDVELATKLRDRLVRHYGKVVLSEGQVWRYDTNHWNSIADFDLRQAVHEFDGVVYTTSGGSKTCVKLSKGRIDSILYEFAALIAEPRFFEVDTVGINCVSGFIRFEPDGTPTLVPHDPDHRRRHVLPGSWDEQGSADPPSGSLLARLLSGIFQDDDDQQQKSDLIAEICGCAALGYATRLTQPKAVILKGETAENGKSQVLDIIRGLLPLTATCTIPAARMKDDRYLVGLAGKLLNASDELSSSSAVSSDVFKTVVTGEPVTGRDVYRSRTEFRPVAQHVFATNALPEFKGGIDRGVQRRLLVLCFNRVIPDAERIEHIGRRIGEVEPDLLLAWAVEGASRLIRQGKFTEPRSSKEALANWLFEEDLVAAWVNDRVVIDPNAKIRTRDAHADFIAWGIAEGFKPGNLPARNPFVRAVPTKARGVEYKRQATARVFLGMTIRNKPRMAEAA